MFSLIDFPFIMFHCIYRILKLSGCCGGAFLRGGEDRVGVGGVVGRDEEAVFAAPFLQDG